MSYATKIRILASFLAAATLFLASNAGAQTVIEGGTVHTVTGEVIEGGTVVIAADGTIAAVGKGLEKPDGATVVDATGKVVTPGLVEASSALGLVEISAVEGANDVYADDLEQDRILAGLRATDAFNANSAVIPVQRTGGVTSVVSVPRSGIISGQALWADLGGDGTNATVIEPIVALFGSTTRWTVRTAGNSRASLWLDIRELIDDARYYAANTASFDQNNSRKLHASRLDLAAFGPVLDGSRPLVLAVNRAADIRTALELAKANNIRLIVLGGTEAWMVAKELAEANVTVMVDPLENLPGSFGRLGARADNAALLHAAGVPVVITTDDTHNVRNLRQLAGNAVRAGLPHEAALAAVTIAPAQAMGLGDRYGSLEPGKVANVVVWSGDPFELGSRVERMYVGGKETSLDNRQQKLFERYRELQRRGEALGYPEEN